MSDEKSRLQCYKDRDSLALGLLITSYVGQLVKHGEYL